MAGNEHSAAEEVSFPQPRDETVPVRRYLDLPRFIYLLDTEELFLPRVDLLADRHEGAVPRWEHESRGGAAGGEQLRQSAYVSCWHLNERESEAMWRLYCPMPEGVAIRTTYRKLRDSLDEPGMRIGLVTYLDYERDRFDRECVYNRFMHKRVEFAHEREVRIVKVAAESAKVDAPGGISIRWNLLDVIGDVYVNPYAEAWYFEVVTRLVQRLKPELSERIRWSEMTKEPYY